MTVDHKDIMKNQLTSEGASYSSKNVSLITYILHKQLGNFINHIQIFYKDTKNQEDDKNRAPDVETQGQANATITTSDIKELVKSMMQEFKPDGRKEN